MTPYIGFSHDTLAKLPGVKRGDTVKCPNCQQEHVLEAADDGSETLLFYHCADKVYLGAIGGKCTVGAKTDVSGKL